MNSFIQPISPSCWKSISYTIPYETCICDSHNGDSDDGDSSLWGCLSSASRPSWFPQPVKHHREKLTSFQRAAPHALMSHDTCNPQLPHRKVWLGKIWAPLESSAGLQFELRAQNFDMQDPNLIKMVCSTWIRHFLLEQQTLPSLNRLKNPIEIEQRCSLLFFCAFKCNND